MKNTNRSVTLALGGGGVKCFAHIGVLQAIQELNYEVKGIAATSAGALIAALFASGQSPEHIIRMASQFDFKSLSRIHRSERAALWGLARWRRLFKKLFGRTTIESLSIPIAFPLVDLERNTEIVVDSGPVVDAVTAAVAIPGIFPPQRLGNRTVIDGGVLNPIPVNLARSQAPTAISIAVPLVPAIDQWDQHPFPRLINTVPLFRVLGNFRYTQALGVYIHASDLTNRLLAEYRLDKEAPDRIIRPEVNHLGLFDKIDIESVVAAGKTAAMRILQEPYA